MEKDKDTLFGKIDHLSSMGRGFQSAVVLTTAVRMELFTLLDTGDGLGSLSAGEVAQRLGLDPRATAVFLRALAGTGLLEVDSSGRFSNSEIASELLVKGKPYFQGDILAHSGNLMSRWLELPYVLETGKPAEGPRVTEDKTLCRDFILGMSNIAGLSAENVARNIQLDKTHRLLDLGGGPGTYAIAFCRMYPGLSATIFDLPQVIDEITAGQVAAANLEGRISLLKGNYLVDDIGSGYDLILVSNIIHSLGEKDTVFLYRRCFQALDSGGRVIVKDFLMEDDRINPPFSSMFAVNMLVGTEAGRCYTVSEVRSGLAGEGFRNEKLVELNPRDRMVIAVKP